MILRPYQQDAIDAIWNNLDAHAVAVLPTASGKTIIAAELIKRFLQWPDTHIAVITHRRELIQQDYDALKQYLSDASIDIGIYCAGLKQKKLAQITVASVQSLARAKKIPGFEILIVDEAHWIGRKEASQYHQIIKRLPNARLIGLTATAFRLDSGSLIEGDDRLFERISIELKTGDLIKDGFLSPIRAKAVAESADTTGVHTRGGEYILQEMQAAVDKDSLTQCAVQEVLTHAADRTSILVFGSGIEHCKHIEDAFKAVGQTSIATITEKTNPHDRVDYVERFKRREIRILINCMIYTEGFNAPNVDCLCVLRCTNSAGLWMQICGRGLRKAEGKKNCLILDFGNHAAKFGPLDMITMESVTKKDGVAPVKTCPQCQHIIFAGFRVCPECNFIFPEPEKKAPDHSRHASTVDPISATIIKEYKVLEVAYRLHKKTGKPDSIRVEYRVGLWDIVKEYLCPEHGGFPTQKAISWFARRGVSMPETTSKALDICWRLPKPKSIMVKQGGEYDEIVSYKW